MPAITPSRSTTLHPLQRIFASAFVWGTAATFAFYASIPYLPVEREFVTRYFAGHWIEYATTWAFLVGMAIVARKALSIPVERGVFATVLVPQRSDDSSTERQLDLVEHGLGQLPPAGRRTLLAQRLEQACSYLRGGGATSALDEHLKYMAELASERMHGSYALVRTVTWAIPILGFLGTVIGITMAIANVTPEQLESSLTEVTSGLAVAFDTTALSLALSMLLVFCTFIVERAEGQVLSEVEQFAIGRIVPCFAAPDKPAAGPWAEAEALAARQLLDGTEALIRQQTELWQATLEDLRARWLSTADTQQRAFAQALEQGMSQSLSTHAAQLAEFRNEFIAAFRGSASEFAKVAGTIQLVSEQQQSAFAQQTAELVSRVGQQLGSLESTGRENTAAVVLKINDAVEGWHRDLAATTSALTSQTRELTEQGRVLQAIAADEGKLARLQETLNDNLRTLRSLDTLDETLHSLSAAVHLLTVRSKHAA